MDNQVTGIVKSVQGSGTWESNYGLLYSFEYTFEDGVILKANHKTDQPFAVGEKVLYEVKKETEFGKIGKVSKYKDYADLSQYKDTTPKTYLDNTKGIKIGHAISNAVALVGTIGLLSNDHDQPISLPESIKEYAKMIYNISEQLNQEL